MDCGFLKKNEKPMQATADQEIWKKDANSNVLLKSNIWLVTMKYIKEDNPFKRGINFD